MTKTIFLMSVLSVAIMACADNPPPAASSPGAAASAAPAAAASAAPAAPAAPAK